MPFQIHVPPGWTVAVDKSRLKQVMRSVGQEIAARAKGLIREGGATPKRKAKRTSAAGAPPVSRTGNLARGIRVKPWRSGEGVTVVDNAASKNEAFYSRFVELGAQGGVSPGRRGGKGASNLRRVVRGQKTRVVTGTHVIAPHPFMEPALAQVAAAGLGERVRDALVSGLAFRRGPK